MVTAFVKPTLQESDDWGYVRPMNIEKPHWQEWTNGSCISSQISAATLESISDRKKIRKFLGWKQYPEKNPLGWIAYSGEFDGTRSEVWGQFKPNEPLKLNGNESKYITPKIVEGSDEKQDCIILPIRTSEQWQVILGDLSIPIGITEGFKKSGALETQGIVTCGVVGVTRWHSKGDSSKLYPKLKAFAVPNRRFEIYLDSDWQQNPKVRGQMIQMSEVLTNLGCIPVIKTWDYSHDTKGIDDLIKAFPDTWREKISEISLADLKELDKRLEQEKDQQIYHDYEKFKKKYRYIVNISKIKDDDGNEKLVIPLYDHFQLDKAFGNGRIRYHEMLGDYELDGKPIDWNTLRIQLEGNGHKFNSRERCEEVVRMIGNADSYSPVRDYLNSLPEVDPSYLDTLAAKYFGVSQTDELSKLYLRKWLIGAVRRALEPGTLMDYMLVLVGSQGAGKTEFFRRLASQNFFTDTFGGGNDVCNKDELAKLGRYWILELGELDYLFGRTASEQFKRFLSVKVDNYRVAYGRGNKDYPRSCAFAGTTNQHELLNDETGNRRYFLIEVPKGWDIPLCLLEKDRDLIWGAAVEAYRRGESHFIPKEYKELLEERNRSHLEKDIWLQPVQNFLLFGEGRSAEYLQSADILRNAVKKDVAHLTQSDQRRVTKVMMTLGWQKINKKINGSVLKVWVPPSAVAGSGSQNSAATTSATAETIDNTSFQQKGSGGSGSQNNAATTSATAEIIDNTSFQQKGSGVAEVFPLKDKPEEKIKDKPEEAENNFYFSSSDTFREEITPLPATQAQNLNIASVPSVAEVKNTSATTPLPATLPDSEPMSKPFDPGAIASVFLEKLEQSNAGEQLYNLMLSLSDDQRHSVAACLTETSKNRVTLKLYDYKIQGATDKQNVEVATATSIPTPLSNPFADHDRPCSERKISPLWNRTQIEPNIDDLAQQLRQILKDPKAVEIFWIQAGLGCQKRLMQVLTPEEIACVEEACRE